MNLSLNKKIAVVVGIASISLGFVAYNVNANAPQNAIKFEYSKAPITYPTKEWQYSNLTAEQKAKLDAIAQKAFVNPKTDLGETRALLVVKGGKIVFEKYGDKFDKDSRLISWSMAKSITSALFGIMQKDGKLSLDAPINDPHWKSDDKRAKITYRQALTMTDGLNWREENYSDAIHNDAAIMLFGKGREDIVKYATSRPLKNNPGEVWNYSSGTTNIIAAGVSRALGPRNISDPTGRDAMRAFMYDRLFTPIGMKSTSAEFDANGNFYGSSLVYSTAQDFARFGLLFLRGGNWDGKQIINEDFVNFVRTPSSGKGADHYGAHWWLSPPNGKGILKKGPFDAFAAQGHEGQIIMVIPSKDMVIVRLGLSTSENHWDAIGEQLQEIVDAL